MREGWLHGTDDSVFWFPRAFSDYNSLLRLSTQNVRFELLTVVTMRISIFLGVKPRTLVTDVLGETYYIRS
jgi:hypothetical protein